MLRLRAKGPADSAGLPWNDPTTWPDPTGAGGVPARHRRQRHIRHTIRYQLERVRIDDLHIARRMPQVDDLLARNPRGNTAGCGRSLEAIPEKHQLVESADGIQGSPSVIAAFPPSP